MLVLANIKSLDSYSHHLIWNVWILKGYSIRNNINSNVGTMCDAFDHKCILNYRFQNGQNLGISFPQETFAADSFLLYVYFFIFDRAQLDFCTLITFNYRLLFRVYMSLECLDFTSCALDIFFHVNKCEQLALID